MRYFVVVSGNMGVGKTTLTKLLSQRLNWEAFLAVASNNPYLPDFFNNMHLWGLHVQLFYLARHLHDSYSISSTEQSIIRDRSFYEGAEIYARNLHEQGILSERDWELYHSLYKSIIPLLPKPDLMVYLRADVSVLIQRIAQRARPGEHNVKAEYLTRLNLLYDLWVNNFDLCPVLQVSDDNLDFARRPEHLDEIVKAIKEKLRIEE